MAYVSKEAAIIFCAGEIDQILYKGGMTDNKFREYCKKEARELREENFAVVIKYFNTAKEAEDYADRITMVSIRALTGY